MIDRARICALLLLGSRGRFPFFPGKGITIVRNNEQLTINDIGRAIISPVKRRIIAAIIRPDNEIVYSSRLRKLRASRNGAQSSNRSLSDLPDCDRNDLQWWPLRHRMPA